MITLRLEPKLEAAVAHTAKSAGLSKSELVRRGILEYLDRNHSTNSWEAGKELFAKHGSGRNDSSVNASSLFKDRLRAKRK